MKTKILITLTCLLWQALAWGQATLVKDIYPLDGSSLYNYGAWEQFYWSSSELDNNIILFQANNSVNGKELWKSDGTEQGTMLLKDILQGDRLTSSEPLGFFADKGIMYFSVKINDQYELWRSNGKTDGTFKIWNLENSYQNITKFVVDTTLFHLLPSYGLVIKNPNNTDYKTVINKSFSLLIKTFPYIEDENTVSKFGNKWLFLAETIQNKIGLFISDETSQGTTLLASLNASYQNLIIKSTKSLQNNLAFFVQDDGSNGNELWKTDGTISGTKIVKNIAPGGLSSIQSNYNLFLTTVNNGVVFGADDGINGYELWFSDGTDTGTKMIKEFITGKQDFSFIFKYMFTKDNLVYFTRGPRELWKTDGTTNGTVLVFSTNNTNIIDIGNYTASNYFKQLKDSFYFTVSAQGQNKEIWKSNGNADGNTKLGELNNCLSCPFFNIIGNNFIYAGYDIKNPYRSLSAELWKFPLCSHTAKINIPNGTSFCPGSSVSITGEGNGATSPFTYKWKQGTTDAGTAATLAVTKAGTYTIEVTDKEGCTVSASVDITQTTNLPINITGANSFCSGQSTTLSATATGGVSPYTYQWKQNSTNVGTNTTTYAASTAGSYSVSVTDSKGCTGTSAAYSVTQKPSPNVTVSTSRTPALLTGESVVLSVPTASGQTYQWAKDGTAISGATNNSYTVSGAGSYTVTVIGGGCTATSSAVMVSIILANEPLEEEVGLRVSPNPTVNQAKIVLQLAQSAAANVYVLDASGRRVRTWESAGKANRHEVMLDMRSVSAGSYVVQAEAEGQVFTEKLVKQ